MSKLNNGQTFPTMSVAKVGGGTLSLPADLAGSFGVVLVYRGAWCPICDRQMADFAASNAALTALGVKVAALSVDDEAASTAFVAKHGLAFPVGHSADADQVSALLGSYVNPAPHFLQPTNFVLGPDGTVLLSNYYSGAVGRLSAADVIGMVTYIKSKAA